MTSQTIAGSKAESPGRDALRRYVAEFIGTFVLVFAGVGCAVVAGARVGPLGISFAFGFALLAMVYALGPISGCHLNPAVTLGLLLAGKLDRRHVFGYWAAQSLGGLAAAGAVLGIARGARGGYSAAQSGLGANGFGDHSPGGYGVVAAFGTELVLTAILVVTVLLVTDARAPVGFAGLAIGVALALVHLVGIPVTNLSVNPARSLGTALFAGGWALLQLWLFVLAPLLGGAVAAALYRTLRLPPEEKLSATEAERALEHERVARARAEPIESP